MIQIRDRDNNLIEAPNFPGWVTLGLDQIAMEGDVFVTYQSSFKSDNPNTSRNIICSTSHLIDRIPRNEGETDVFCLYRKQKWRLLDHNEPLLNGDFVPHEPGDPNLKCLMGESFHYHNFHYLSRKSTVYASYFVFQAWRPINPAKRILAGNPHYGKPLPLP